jgi:homoserine kinase
VVVAVPVERLSTEQARAAIPTRVPVEVAVRTAARLMMLVEGLRTADPVSFRAAGGDEIHEAPRAALTATPGRLIEAARDAGALHAAWSGAGPSVLALCTEDVIESVVGGLSDTDPDGEVLRLDIEREGVRLE